MLSVYVLALLIVFYILEKRDASSISKKRISFEGKKIYSNFALTMFIIPQKKGE